ncbi:hypothetical protein A6M27_05680 [Acidithiobacillus thiooxidans]|jgi:hypothetical protein|uniref:Uncharacterized protein n=1 Tax=Acidithiobacillus thiooxidans TaxID=930 RepID=A0A1C2IG10_ACITH|nr:hypothetical protein [Acidithiobacillus thiooxidans]OCX72529.1 hypothetical protein A6P07_09625 [Acidithiobacillus thiooxidans]OCX74910.1 hypothetical protein A6O24_10350 [Acidithiobacillus thiooxidans]OCX80084.1 hypothetical protein A6O26_15810 [Acidithiobacillus thiooxidans]OCX88792.1 hypothetical protein A6M27_05680 [Acidithiobacillus thiooxidans]OFC40698.1 hypothetical protein BAE47_19765 [Acidithiobacillus thiooxidans]
MTESKKRVRRTPEQRIADLEKKQAAILERQKAALARIEAAKKRLLQSPSARKDRMEQDKRFIRAAQALAPEWDARHFIAAIEKALQEDAEVLQARGESLLKENGQPRRGRRPRMD